MIRSLSGVKCGTFAPSQLLLGEASGSNGLLRLKAQHLELETAGR